MSEAISALNKVENTGGIARIREIGLQGMVTLRGDLATLAAATRPIAGVELPGPGQAHFAEGHGLCWMSPDELLLLCPYGDAPSAVAQLTVALRDAHALVANVSDARAVFEISGPHARDVMAKLAPVDFSTFAPGQFRRSRLAQVPAAFWMPQEDSFRIICFRSVARYVFDLLCVAAQPGSEIAVN